MQKIGVILDTLNELNTCSIIFRALLACVCGAVIGIERGKSNQAAGMRTHILVCLGATLIMLTGEYMYHEFNAGDPARLGAQVISGIGFLGAGSIILEGKTKVRGLTTAAGLWTAACIGLAIGIGFYAGGVVITIIVHIVITKCKPLSDHFTHNNMWMIYYMEIRSICYLESIRTAIAAYGLEIGDITLNNPHNTGDYNIIVLIKNAECKDCSLIEEYMKNIEGIDALKCIYV